MKIIQILYLAVFIGIVVCIVTSTHILSDSEGYQDSIPSEPVIPKSIEPTRLSMQAAPNSSIPGTLPFGPYGQQASVGSYQYQDPAQLSATLDQLQRLYEDIRGFLVFEGVSIANSSDPTVQLPLTQLRADSRRLEEEMSVLRNNPGIQSSMTQQTITDIQSALVFLQRKVRLFQTSGVSTTTEGFQDGSDSGKTRATQDDLQALQTKVYAAILTLSSSGTTDSVVQARIKNLQDMYSGLSSMITKLNNGVWTPSNIPIFQEDISTILPNLDNPSTSIDMPFSSEYSFNSGSAIERQLVGLVGKDNVKGVLKDIKKNGMFRVNVELGYNVPGSRSGTSEDDAKSSMLTMSNNIDLLSGTSDSTHVTDMETSSPFDSTVPGAEENNSAVGGLDWKNRAESICEQVRLRGLDPQDFGCIVSGSTMSPAYSWRGHTKMVCGRLGATMDPNLPVVCGCPPQRWKGWGNF